MRMIVLSGCAAYATVLLMATCVTSFAASIPATLIKTFELGKTSPVAVKGFAVSPQQLIFLTVPADAPQVNPSVVQINRKSFGRDTVVQLSSQYVNGVDSTASGKVVVLQKNNDDRADTKTSLRVISSSGTPVAEVPTPSSIATFTTVGDDVISLFRDGTVRSVTNSGPPKPLQLVSDKQPFPKGVILRGAVSFFSLPDGRVAAVTRATGTIDVGSLETGKVDTFQISGPEFEVAKQAYIDNAAQVAKTALPNTKPGFPITALATVAGPGGALYTLITPYSQTKGATIVRTALNGKRLDPITVPLNVFGGSVFNPMFLAIQNNTVFLAAFDGKVAMFEVNR